MGCATRHVTSLGHHGGKSFLRKAQIFYTMSNTFFQEGGKLFQGEEEARIHRELQLKLFKLLKPVFCSS